FYALAGNIAINNCFNVRAILAAVGASHGEMPVPHIDYSIASSFGSLELKRRRDTECIGQPVDYDNVVAHVPLMTLDSLDLTRVDLIKIDVEGMEVEALEGAAQILTRHKPLLFIESLKSGRRTLTSHLQRYGYEFSS